MAEHDRVSRALGLAAQVYAPELPKPATLDRLARALYRYREGFHVVGFLVALGVAVLLAVLFDD